MPIKVNPEDWNSLSTKDQKKTREIISRFFKGQSIETDPSSPRLSLPLNLNDNADEDWCTSLCNIAEIGGTLACGTDQSCIAIVKAAAIACRAAC
jgi:hypothetical protein